MYRHTAVAVAALMSGCTVAWTDLRTENAAASGWACPASLKVDVASAHTTNTFGPKEAPPDEIQELQTRYRTAAERVLNERSCVSSHNKNSEELQIRVENMQQLSALPQEYLTGMSLGLIPSWGTRPAETHFTFTQGSREATYLVDEKRVNHLVLFPVFWLSFFLVDGEAEFEKALNDFTTGL